MIDLNAALADLADTANVTQPDWDALDRRAARRKRNHVWLASAGSIVSASLLVAAGMQLRPPAKAHVVQIAGIESFTGLGQEHVVGRVNYPESPPVGGPHNSVPQSCRFYPRPISNVHAVHSLEHGAIWITYGPTVTEGAKASLAAFAGENAGIVLVSEYPQLGDLVTVQAWGARLELAGADDPRLRTFFNTYANRGPERGAVCVGTLQTVAQPDDLTPPAKQLVGTLPADAATQVIGLSEAEAAQALLLAGIEPRVAERDGMPIPGFRNYDPYRINLTITRGLVSAATVG